MSTYELLVPHTGCLEETESLPKAREELEQNVSVSHIHLRKLDDDETRDRVLVTILEDQRMFCV